MTEEQTRAELEKMNYSPDEIEDHIFQIRRRAKGYFVQPEAKAYMQELRDNR